MSELLSLRVKDVWDFKRKAVVEAVGVGRQSMKGKKEGRTVLLHPDAQAALEKWILFLYGKGIGEENAGDRIFQMGRRHAGRIVAELATQCGLSGHVSTHSWRKTFARNMYDALGNDIVATSAAMGHKNIRTTQCYLQANTEKINAAILKI